MKIGANSRSDYRSHTGSAALCHAGGGFYKCGSGGSTQNCTCGGGNCICHQCRLDLGQLTVLVQHIALVAHADQCAQCVENIHEQEREDNHDKVHNADTVKVEFEALPERIAQ